ncbi:hypothetical protein CCP2SC5_920010 [Azospirillaceae bacterium]
MRVVTRLRNVGGGTMKIQTKLVNIQGCYKIPVDYLYIARNHSGIMNGFMNPPIRDFKTGEWQDSVTGDYGYFIPYDSWDISVRKIVELTDAAETRRRTLREKQKPTKGYVDGRTIRSNYTKNRPK